MLALAGALLAGLPLGAPASAPAMGKADHPLARQMAAPVHSGWARVIVRTDGALNAAQNAQLTHLGAAMLLRDGLPEHPRRHRQHGESHG